MLHSRLECWWWAFNLDRGLLTNMKILANSGFDFDLIFWLSPNIFSNFSVSSLCLIYAFIETISANICLASQLASQLQGVVLIKKIVQLKYSGKTTGTKKAQLQTSSYTVTRCHVMAIDIELLYDKPRKHYTCSDVATTDRISKSYQKTKVMKYPWLK